jgi:hypothetical protein
LFDGHGPQGHLVSEFCVKQARKFYEETELDDNPGAFIIDMCHLIDEKLERTAIDTENSGSTGVFVLYTDG